MNPSNAFAADEVHQASRDVSSCKVMFGALRHIDRGHHQETSLSSHLRQGGAAREHLQEHGDRRRHQTSHQGRRAVQQSRILRSLLGHRGGGPIGNRPRRQPLCTFR